MAPTGLAPDASSIEEKSAEGTDIGTLSATDPEGEALTYFFVSDVGGLFILDGSMVKVSGVLDYEMAASHEITARVEDPDGAGIEETYSGG